MCPVSRQSFNVLLGIWLLAISVQWANAGEPFVVGGFDASRGGLYSFQSGAFLDEARASLASHFAEASLISFSSLTSESLAGADIVFLSVATSNTAGIVPLSSNEQDALLNFVRQGGCAVVFPENSGFDVIDPAINESVIDPFGMDIAGVLSGIVTAAVLDPSVSPLTEGPFGTISSFTQNVPGNLTALGPYGVSLAINPLGIALAVIEPGAISSGSGPVVIYTDVNTFGDADAAGLFSQNENLFLNTIHFCTLTPSKQLQNLIEDVVAINLRKGISSSLDAKLEAAVKALDDMNENNDTAAIQSLEAFIHYVEVQRGISISDLDADALIAAAQRIIVLLRD